MKPKNTLAVQTEKNQAKSALIEIIKEKGGISVEGRLIRQVGVEAFELYKYLPAKQNNPEHEYTDDLGYSIKTTKYTYQRYRLDFNILYYLVGASEIDANSKLEYTTEEWKQIIDAFFRCLQERCFKDGFDDHVWELYREIILAVLPQMQYDDLEKLIAYFTRLKLNKENINALINSILAMGSEQEPWLLKILNEKPTGQFFALLKDNHVFFIALLKKSIVQKILTVKGHEKLQAVFGMLAAMHSVPKVEIEFTKLSETFNDCFAATEKFFTIAPSKSSMADKDFMSIAEILYLDNDRKEILKRLIKSTVCLSSECFEKQYNLLGKIAELIPLYQQNILSQDQVYKIASDELQYQTYVKYLEITKINFTNIKDADKKKLEDEIKTIQNFYEGKYFKYLKEEVLEPIDKEKNRFIGEIFSVFDQAKEADRANELNVLKEVITYTIIEAAAQPEAMQKDGNGFNQKLNQCLYTKIELRAKEEMINNHRSPILAILKGLVCTLLAAFGLFLPLASRSYRHACYSTNTRVKLEGIITTLKNNDSLQPPSEKNASEEIEARLANRLHR